MKVSAEPFAYVISFNDDRPGVRVPIDGPSFAIGRDPTNQFCVTDDQTVSRQHCIIHVDGSSLLLEDLNSRNGTYLSGKRIGGTIELPVPSTVMVGHTRLAVVPAVSDDADATSVIETSYSSEGSIIVPPSVFFKVRTDAFFVVDLVNSTGLIQTDDSRLAKVMLALGRTLERKLRTEPQPFLKCTGDGFFACFSTPNAALEVAASLSSEVLPLLPLKVQFSMALHWGAAHLTEQGDRTGRNVHAVFSLEYLRHELDDLAQELASGRAEQLILMTEDFWTQLEEHNRRRAVLLGKFPLKGMEEGATIYRWRG